MVYTRLAPPRFRAPLTLVPTKDQPGGIPTNAQLYFGTDGTLYANAPGDVLRAIVPQYTLSANSAAKITSPTHLRVDGEVVKDTELKAGGSVLLGTGFKVKQGATLKITTGQ